MAKKSRYADTAMFQPDPRGNSDFKGVRPREISRATGIVEHRVTAGERLDQLSNHYFNDDRNWWRIGDASQTFAVQHKDQPGDKPVERLVRLFYAPDMLADMSHLALPGAEPDPLEREDMTGRIVLIPRARE